MSEVDVSAFSRIDYWSLAAVPIHTFFNDQPLSHGTGFFYTAAGTTFLVTAWHVLSGQNAETGENLSPTGGRPNRVRVWWHPLGLRAGAVVPQDVSIMDADGEPLWFRSPDEEGHWVDMAVLPISRPAGVMAYPINELPERAVELGMGQDVFVVGFPLPDQPLNLPIWKRGSLASEIMIPSGLQAYWLVDTASRSGMSGSPVIARTYPHDASVLNRRYTDPRHRGDMGNTVFLGVYSGRFRGPAPEDLQLGIVWPRRLLDLTIESCLRWLSERST